MELGLNITYTQPLDRVHLRSAHVYRGPKGAFHWITEAEGGS